MASESGTFSGQKALTVAALVLAVLALISSLLFGTGAIGVGSQSTAQGLPGIQGTQGATGPQGPQGETGAQGARGETGAQGATGASGAAGVPGADGLNGLDGRDGADGAPGSPGMQGLPGAQGPEGPAGADGQDGATGAQGPAGPVGPAGPTGPQGPTGPAASSKVQYLYGSGLVVPPNGNSYVPFPQSTLTQLFDADGNSLGPRENGYYRVSFWAALSGGTIGESLRVELRRNDDPIRYAARTFTVTERPSGLADLVEIEQVFYIETGQWIDVRVWALPGHTRSIVIQNEALVIEKLS